MENFPLQLKVRLILEILTSMGHLSSQFLTGLLMAYAAAMQRGVSIKVNNLKSQPYIDLTLQVMKEFGLKVPENKNYEEFYFSPASIRCSTLNAPISND